MGYAILASGQSVWVEDLNGSVNVSMIVHDILSDDYSDSFRISMIGALGKLGANAADTVDSLKKLAKSGGILAEAADQAIKSIEKGGTVGHPVHKTTPFAQTVQTHAKRVELNKVSFTEIESSDNLHDGLKHYLRCTFCDKMTLVNDYVKEFSDKLADPSRFYCPFCIRNDFYQRHGANVLVLTFRGIFGYYLYCHYLTQKNTTQLVLADIQDYIDQHVRIGLQNPLFVYDYETYNWFIDFSKVGKKRMPIECVLKTIIGQLGAMAIYENVKDCSPMKLYNKYKQAVLEFSQTRTRTNGEKVFVPTLWGCGIPTCCSAGTRAISAEVLQNFTPGVLADASKLGSRRFSGAM